MNEAVRVRLRCILFHQGLLPAGLLFADDHAARPAAQALVSRRSPRGVCRHLCQLPPRILLMDTIYRHRHTLKPGERGQA